VPPEGNYAFRRRKGKRIWSANRRARGGIHYGSVPLAAALVTQWFAIRQSAMVAARRLGGHWLIFAEASVRGQRQIRRLFVGPRSTVCEAFAEPILDE
jgi:hypothetical protein